MRRKRTEAQRNAARQNGAKSQGPTSPEGKARVSQNALRHGLTSKRVVLANENPAQWDSLVEALTEEWQPETLTEFDLLQDLAAARWRLCRVLDYEKSLMDLEAAKSYDAYLEFLPDGETETLNAIVWQALTRDGCLPSIHRHETRLRRIIKDCITQLTALKAARRAAAAAPAVTTAEVEKPKLQNKPELVPQPASKVQNKPGDTPKAIQPSPAQPPQSPIRGPERLPSGPKAA
jgi:hypothetical protein